MEAKTKKVIVWSVVAIAGAIGIWQVASAIKRKRDRKEAEEAAKAAAAASAANQNQGTQIAGTGTSAQVVTETPAALNYTKIMRPNSPASPELKAAKNLFNKAILAARGKSIKADPKISTSESFWKDKATRLERIANLETLDVDSKYGEATKKVVTSILGYTDFNLKKAVEWEKNWQGWLQKYTA